MIKMMTAEEAQASTFRALRKKIPANRLKSRKSNADTPSTTRCTACRPETTIPSRNTFDRGLLQNSPKIKAPSNRRCSAVATFCEMAYIIVVNLPKILAQAGMPPRGVPVATCISAAVRTLVMPRPLANYPIGWRREMS